MPNTFENPQVPGVTNQVFNPDQLIGGNFPLATKGDGVILSGSGALKRGTILGRITVGGAASAVKASGANTGNGTFVLDVTTPVRPGGLVGIYTLRCITAAANGGVFRLEDPNGFVLGDFTITGGAGGTVTVDDDIKGVLTDGATDFIVGDGFDITVAAGSGKYKTAVATAIDGSAVPSAVLADDVDATSADKKCGLYLTGQFNNRAITYDGSYSLAALTELLRAFSIFLVTSVSAATPT